MKKRMLVALTAAILSVAAEAQVGHTQPVQRRAEPQPVERRAEPENRSVRPNNNFQPERRASGERPRGVRIDPGYFAAHYGRAHGFHFNNYAGGPCIGNCGFTIVGSEWYFSWNGGWFGITTQLPGNWAFQTDYLYIDMADDGNYYLYDAQFPGMAVQLTFVQNVGDDQDSGDQE
jgi:hypothetical protein